MHGKWGPPSPPETYMGKCPACGTITDLEMKVCQECGRCCCDGDCHHGPYQAAAAPPRRRIRGVLSLFGRR